MQLRQAEVRRCEAAHGKVCFQNLPERRNKHATHEHVVGPRLQVTAVAQSPI
jgi:hypothetical protein